MNSAYKPNAELTIETKEGRSGGPCWLLQLRQMGSQGVHMKGVLPWLVLWSRHAGYKRLLSFLGCSSLPSKKLFFPYHILFPRDGQQAVRQLCGVACLFIYVSGNIQVGPIYQLWLLLPPLARSCNGTTAGLGYWKVGLEWPYNTPPGQWICDSTIKLEDVDGLND